MFLAVGCHILTLKPELITIVVHLIWVEEKWAIGQDFRRVRKSAKSDYWLRNVSLFLSLSLSLSLFVHMEQLGSHWKDFREIWYQHFSKTCREISSSSKSDKNKGYRARRLIYIYENISLHSFWNEKFLGTFVEKIKTHFVTTSFSENRAINEIIWENMVQPEKATDNNMTHAHFILNN